MYSTSALYINLSDFGERESSVICGPPPEMSPAMRPVFSPLRGLSVPAPPRALDLSGRQNGHCCSARGWRWLEMAGDGHWHDGGHLAMARPWWSGGQWLSMASIGA